MRIARFPTPARLLLILLLLLLLPAVHGCASAASQLPGYEASIRRTSHGVAHIEAADLGSLGFGEGYAQAEDHLCTIADQVVMARGERARYFGRGAADAHLLGDIGMRALGVHERAGEMLAAQPREIREWLAGFAAGYNRYLEQTGRDAVPGWCGGEAWVVPISGQDVAAVQRALTLTSTNFLPAIASAQPPGSGERTSLGELPAPRPTASNGWALGRDHTRSGRGMLLANPHYPWVGGSRFWEKHLIIPGELDVYGAGLLGNPGVQIGFNAAVGWTHTVSAGTRYTLYRLELVEGQPTRYRYGSDVREMRPVEVQVEVRGAAEPERRTLWFTHYGPVIAGRGIEWTADHAIALRDANEENAQGAAHWLAMSRAGSMAAFQQAFAEFQGIPWVNTIATSAEGVAWYIDSSATPRLSDAALAAWLDLRERDPLTRQLWGGNRMVLLDGSDPRFEWQEHPAARLPGTVPLEEMPQQQRSDYVFNANDSFWLANPAAPIEGAYSPLHGSQRAPLSLRTRSNVLHVENATADRPAGADGRFDLAALQSAALGNRSLTADLLLPELVQRCVASPGTSTERSPVDLTAACAVLASWDRRLDLESRGAVLFREWLGQYPPGALTGAGELFAVPFDHADPVNTPRGLAPGARALERLAAAVSILDGRGLSLDVPLGELQYAPSKLPRRMPVHGGNGHEGVLNLQVFGAGPSTLEPLEIAPRVPGSRFLTEEGYPVTHGSSFLMALEYTPAGPRAMTLLTYGQSGDPQSEHFVDQTRLFARKEWRPVRFAADAIEADVQRAYTVAGSRAIDAAGRRNAR